MQSEVGTVGSPSPTKCVARTLAISIKHRVDYAYLLCGAMS